jgi:hypothetical protein
MILGLCERFGCLPSQLMTEDVGLLRLVAIEDLGRDKTSKNTDEEGV